MKRHNHYALRIKENGWKINFLLIRGYIPIIANWQAIELVQQTGQFSRKHCLYLLDSSLLTQKKKNQCRQLCLHIFCTRIYSDRVAQHRKNLSQAPEAYLSPTRYSYGVNCKRKMRMAN